ncbi:MAG: Uma2 family endonuclease, partial [Cyanobacteria bacterium J149]
MSVSPKTLMKWTSADLELLPENDYRYEIIDGELYVTRAPHWK